MGRDSGIGSVGGTVGRPKDYPTSCPWDCGMGRDSGIGSVGGTVGRPKDHPTVHGTVGWDGTVG